jgi:hypothetical protein
MKRPLSFKIMISLALVQGAFGLLRAFDLVQFGADLFKQGLLIVPLVGAVAVLRGLFVSVVAALYFLFFFGALLGRRWARGVCLTAVVINLLLVLNGLIQGAPVAQAMVWAVIPIILLLYLFSQSGREALTGSAVSG